MLVMPLLIEGKIEEIGDGCVTGGSLTRYSFIRVSGKIYKDIVANNYFSTFIRVGNDVRMGLKRQLAGGPVICSLEINGEIHKIGIGSIIVPTIAIALISLVVVAFLAVGFGTKFETVIKFAICYPIFVLLYAISWVWPRQALGNNAVDNSISATDWGLALAGIIFFPLCAILSLYNFASSRHRSGFLHLATTSMALLTILIMID